MEIKLLITLFILGNIINLLCYRRFPNLSCGLFGFCGSSAPDPSKIRLLALFNLKRGEHATGIYADGIINKDTVPASTFLSKNYEEIEDLANIKNFVVIGHDRQASMGSKDKVDQAHPHGVKEGEKYSFILAHNGTLNFVYQFADHYKQSYTGGTDSDSQVLTKAMASLPEDQLLEPLKRYDGTATVVFHIPKYKHTVFIHRDPQREIYYYQETADRLYWSSIKESLYAIGGDDDTVHEFTGYEVCKISKGKIVKRWSTKDRDPIVYKAPASNNRKNIGFHNRSNFYEHDDISKKAIEPAKTNGFVFNNHRYFLNGHKFTGVLFLNVLKGEWSRENKEGFTKYWFVEGLMAIDEKAYDALYKMGTTKSGIFDAQTFNSQHFVQVCEYTKYPVLAGIEIAKGTMLWPGKYHRTNYKVDGDSMVFCPEFSSNIYKITPNGILIETKVVENLQKPKEAIEETEGFENITEALIECLKVDIDDFANLYIAVRYAMKQPDSSQFYDEVVSTFLDICEQTGAVEREYTADLRNVKHYDRANHESLTTLLQLYHSCKDDNEYTIEDQLEGLKKNNVWWSHHNTFRNDIANLVYTDLDDLLIAYCETDEEEVTKPVMMGIALELNRLGVMSTQDVISLQSYRASEFQRSLNKWYEIYVTNNQMESQNCCVSDPTDIIAQLYLKLADLKSIPQNKITAGQVDELKKLRQQLKNLVLTHKEKINEEKLKAKYELELTTIQSINE